MKQKELGGKFIMKDFKLVKNIDYQIEKEDIIVLEIEDGSLITYRTILLDVIETDQETDQGMVLQFNLQNLVTTLSPEGLQGKKGKKYPMSELEKNIDSPNMMFKKVKGTGINSYILDGGGKLIVKNNISQIDRTTLINSMGMPTYIVRSETLIAQEEKDISEKEEE